MSESSSNDEPDVLVDKPEPRLIRTAVDAEEIAAAWMRWFGFVDAVRTPSGADGGIDVRSEEAVAQVKMHMVAVGRPDLQRLHGVAQSLGKRALFFSLMSYSRQALEWADSVGMACFRFDYTGEPEPMNAPARQLFDGEMRHGPDRHAEIALLLARSKAQAQPSSPASGGQTPSGLVTSPIGGGRVGGPAEQLVNAARASGWSVEYLPVGSVQKFNPGRGEQDCCFRFVRDNAVVIGGTLIGKTGAQHADTFLLYNGQERPVAIEMLYRMLGTLTTPSDENGLAVPTPPRGGGPPTRTPPRLTEGIDRKTKRPS